MENKIRIVQLSINHTNTRRIFTIALGVQKGSSTTDRDDVKRSNLGNLLWDRRLEEVWL